MLDANTGVAVISLLSICYALPCVGFVQAVLFLTHRKDLHTLRRICQNENVHHVCMLLECIHVLCIQQTQAASTMLVFCECQQRDLLCAGMAC